MPKFDVWPGLFDDDVHRSRRVEAKDYRSAVLQMVEADRNGLLEGRYPGTVYARRVSDGIVQRFDVDVEAVPHFTVRKMETLR